MTLSSEWRKSSLSFANGNCAEVRTAGDSVQVRNSREPDGGTLEFPGAEWDAWVKSSFSHANGNCAEVQFLADGEVQVRNSRDPKGGTLTFTAGEWDAFVGGAKLGEFDRLGGQPAPSVTGG